MEPWEWVTMGFFKYLTNVVLNCAGGEGGAHDARAYDTVPGKAPKCVKDIATNCAVVDEELNEFPNAKVIKTTCAAV